MQEAGLKFLTFFCFSQANYVLLWKETLDIEIVSILMDFRELLTHSLKIPTYLMTLLRNDAKFSDRQV